MKRGDAAAFWTAHLDRQRASGLSQRAYCAEHALSLSSFSYWSRKGRREINAEQPTAARFVALEMASAPSTGAGGSSGVRLLCGAVAIVLEIDFDGTTLRRALEALGC